MFRWLFGPKKGKGTPTARPPAPPLQYKHFSDNTPRENHYKAPSSSRPVPMRHSDADIYRNIGRLPPAPAILSDNGVGNALAIIAVAEVIAAIEDRPSGPVQAPESAPAPDLSPSPPPPPPDAPAYDPGQSSTDNSGSY